MQITVQITVPPADPETSAWRKVITALTSAKGGAAIEGAWLQAGDVVSVPVGTLIVAVDKATIGYEYAYHGGERIPVQDATIAVHLATPDGLHPLWSRHYKSARSAFGPTTMKKLAGLLDQHPVSVGEISVLTEAQRPNRRAGQCRWCQATVYAGLGHLVGHGEHIEIEHFQQCPTRLVTRGTPCALCGVTVGAGASAAEVMVREGTGRWETRHAERVGCTVTPPESYEDYTVRITAVHEAAEVARAEQLRRSREYREACERQAAATETAGPTETGRSAARKRNTCDECGQGGARFMRQDSSGIPGVVCARCNRCADYELSFA